MNLLLSERSPLGVFALPEDVGLRQLTVAQLRELASTFSVVDVIPYLARMNVSMQTGRVDDLTLQRTIVGDFFSAKIFRAAEFDGGTPRLLVTPLHLRLSIWLLLRYAARNGGRSLDTPGARQDLGHLLISSPVLADEVEFPGAGAPFPGQL